MCEFSTSNLSDSQLSPSLSVSNRLVLGVCPNKSSVHSSGYKHHYSSQVFLLSALSKVWLDQHTSLIYSKHVPLFTLLSLLVYLPVLHLLNITYYPPHTFTTRYLFNHTFVIVKDWFKGNVGHIFKALLSDGEPGQTESGWIVLEPLDSIFPLSVYSFTSSTQQIRWPRFNPGAVKKPETFITSMLMSSLFCLLPSKDAHGLFHSLPGATVCKNTPEYERKV